MTDSILFTNVRIFDGTGANPFEGEVLVQNNRISKVSPASSPIEANGAIRIDGDGQFLMPGMTDAHTHFSWNDSPGLEPLQRMPVEEHMIWCVRVAKTYLDMGFTSCIGAAAAKPRLDVVLRNAVNAGEFPGPRYLAGSQEFTSTGGLGDFTPPHIDAPEMNIGTICNGPEEVRKAVRQYVKYGVDHIKINLSGEFIAGIDADQCPFDEEEIAMCVAEAKRYGLRVASHARSSESVKQCVRHGIELIFHASFADEEALDLLEANKDKHFVAPGLAWLFGTLYNASEYGVTTEIAEGMGYKRELDAALESLSEMHKRGIKILPGGDYGFAWTPHGTNAKDLQYFVKDVGMTTIDALVSATKLGGEIMMKPDELGLIKPDYLADMILVKGDPIDDIAVLQDPDRIWMVMKDGEMVKPTMAPLEVASGHYV